MSFSLSDDPFDLCAADLPHAREKRPLVCPRREVVIEEDAIALSAWPLLQRQGDQVAESSLRHRVLVRKETIIRIQSDIGSSFHGFRHEVRPQPASQGCWNGVFEEEPDVPALPGP